METVAPRYVAYDRRHDCDHGTGHVRTKSFSHLPKRLRHHGDGGNFQALDPAALAKTVELLDAVSKRRQILLAAFCLCQC